MSTPSSGNTSALGPELGYAYSVSLVERTASTAHIVVVLRLMSMEPLSGALLHETAVLGKTTSRVSIPATALEPHVWADGFEVFDGYVPFGLDDSVVTVSTTIGDDIGGGYDFGTYQRPSKVDSVTLSSCSIDVSEQNDASVTASWEPSDGAYGYRVYLNVDEVLMDVQIVDSGTSATSCTFNPKKEMSNSTSWRSREVLAGYSLHVGVEPYDGNGVSAMDVTWSDALVYTEEEGRSPSYGKLVGSNGNDNEVAYVGEEGVSLYYSGQADGSYDVTDFSLRRDDGVELSWKASDASEEDGFKRIELGMPAYGHADVNAQFELRAYNSAGHPVYAGDGSWAKFSALLYGGIAGVMTDDGWKVGRLWVYDGAGWRMAKAVSVYDGKWKSM